MLESLLDPWRWERSFQDFPDYLAGFGMIDAAKQMR